MGHYDDQSASTRARLDAEHKERVLEVHQHTSGADGTSQDKLKAAMIFLLEAYADHTKNYPDRVTAHMHLGRLKGELT